MARDRKKYTAGDAVAYVSRNKALRKLQLSLGDFRRLCILKGIYPAEPSHRKKVNKGSSAMKTYFYAKDIRFLSHEPIITKFRQLKVFSRKLKTAIAKRDLIKADIIKANKPVLKLDHIVRERYPTFIDALRDLDDCLTLIFLFSTFPSGPNSTSSTIQLCRRLSLEFLHYVMLTRCLRKCFISIKGYYFQADIRGQKVTWILPHSLSFKQPSLVDFKIMKSFIEFYVHMLGFVNFKLYSDINRFYPPKLMFTANEKSREIAADTEFFEEMLASLNISPEMLESVTEEDVDDDADLPVIDDITRQVESKESIARLKNLFAECKFFISREIPREIFAFVIKCFGGEVSWSADLAFGATYQENDDCITHHIIDRPKVEFVHHGRVYVQPQWVFDSINFCQLLPIDNYVPGAELPPHLSPFVVEKPGDYVPPDKIRMESASKPTESTEEQAVKTDESATGQKRKLDETSAEERKLREMMLPKKHRRIYNKAVFSRKRDRREVEKLKMKRKHYEESKKVKTV